MSKMNPNGKKETFPKNEQMANEDATNLQDEQTNATEETDASAKVSDELNALKRKYDELNDSHLRLMAEFDNYRKRTLREKSELIKNGGEKAIIELLPVIDDFERALQNIHKSEEANDIKAIVDGVELIYNKFVSYLSQQGVKAIEAVGKPFDTEMFEAIATIPAPDTEMKGKVLDCVQTGYTLNDKVIRHAKVVVGE
ncbi:nucleotide exchange factor GrpE [Parabacteroides chinchillae]